MQKLGPTIVAVGLVLLVAALLTFFVGVPIIIDDKVKEETQLKEGSSTFEKWRDVPIPVFIKFNIFNVDNPDEINDGGANTKFHVTEYGPYVYEERRKKDIIQIDEERDTVTYKEYIEYYFREDLSVGSDEDAYDVINAPFVIVSTILRKMLYGLANIPINILRLQGENFVRKKIKVKEMIFDGYDASNFMLWVNLSPGGAPAEFEDGKFAFYRGKNGSTDGEYKIYSGVKDHTTFGNIVTFEGRTEIDFWTDKKQPANSQNYCNKINGTDGSIFPPFVEKDRVMRMFVMDICRSVYLTFEKEIEFDGIPGYRFTIPEEMLEDPAINKDNQCFCVDPGSGLYKGCVGGVIRLFPCKDDAPIGTSNPHFLLAPHLQAEVDGLHPNKEAHETTIDVEPRSGQLLQAIKRIQITMELQPLSMVAAYRNVTGPSRMVPLFWAEETAWLNKKETDELKDKLLKPLKLLKIVQWTVIGVCGVTILGGVGLTFYRHKLRNKKV